MSADVVQLFPPVGEKDAPVKPRERDRCRHELVQQREIRWRRRLIEDLKREERNAKARKRRRDSVPAA